MDKHEVLTLFGHSGLEADIKDIKDALDSVGNTRKDSSTAEAFCLTLNHDMLLRSALIIC